jgi:hypothetical protein
MSGIFLGCQESNNMHHKALITHILLVFLLFSKKHKRVNLNEKY